MKRYLDWRGRRGSSTRIDARVIDYPAHLRGFGVDKVEHLRKFVEIHNLSPDRMKKWTQKYLNRDKI